MTKDNGRFSCFNSHVQLPDGMYLVKIPYVKPQGTSLGNEEANRKCRFSTSMFICWVNTDDCQIRLLEGLGSMASKD